MKSSFRFHYILSVPLWSSVAEPQLYFARCFINVMFLRYPSHQKNVEYLTELTNGSIPSLWSGKDEARELVRLVVKENSNTCCKSLISAQAMDELSFWPCLNSSLSEKTDSQILGSPSPFYAPHIFPSPPSSHTYTASWALYAVLKHAFYLHLLIKSFLTVSPYF